MNNNNDEYLIPVSIDDTVQCLKFFPSKEINYLASGGWDSKLRLFEIKYEVSQNYNRENATISASQINECQHQSPILSISWKGNSGTLFTGCVDGSINYIDPQKNQFNKIGQHNSGCKDVIYNNNYNILMTGGWDGALKLWDLRSPNPFTTYQFNNKIYSMSYNNNLLVVALSELVMSYFNLEKLQKSQFEPEIIFNSHLNEQTRKVAIFNDGRGFVQAAVNGRVAVKHISFYSKPKMNQQYGIQDDKDFSFKCHRQARDGYAYIYTINDICINPVYGTVCTAGGDGVYSIWDLQQKMRIHEKKLDNNNLEPNPLTCCEYNQMGNLLALAQGYDWSKGAINASKYSRPKIYVHYLQKDERKKNS